MSDKKTETKGTNGNKQREKIPRTTQVKRLWKSSKSQKPLKEWAREQDSQLVRDWLEYKSLGV